MGKGKDKAGKPKLNTAAAVEIVCPPDRHIPVEFHDIYSILKAGLSVAERARFEEVTQLVESLYSQEFLQLRRSLKHNFLCFSAGAKAQPFMTRVGSGLPTSADLDQREEKFIADFFQLMAQARFHIMSKAEWELAKADRFMFTLPVEVNWNYYDDAMLKRFWTSTRERRDLRTMLPEMADSCLVFHRGISIAEASGMYTNEKIDLLIDYLVTEPVKRVWRWMRRVKGPMVGPKSLNMTESTHANRKVVERRTLRILMPSVWSVIKNFHKSFKLQEPAFKEVVVLYRSSFKPHKHKLPVLQRSHDSRLKDILGGRNINIKCFHDIPMADIDVIFADKKVYLKTLTIIQLLITVVGALVAGVTVLLKGDVDMNMLWSSLSLVAARCGQVYTSAQAERSATIQNMVNILYEKTNDAQEGVVSMLLEDMAEQQLKEAILAYGILYVRESEMTQGLLDQECEDFLANEFNLKIDFAVEDALPRLTEWGMVRPSKAGVRKFEAVHVDEAYKKLEERWNAAFKAMTTGEQPSEFPLTDLLAGSERSPAPPLKPPRTSVNGVEPLANGDGPAAVAAGQSPAKPTAASAAMPAALDAASASQSRRSDGGGGGAPRKNEGGASVAGSTGAKSASSKKSWWSKWFSSSKTKSKAA